MLCFAILIDGGFAKRKIGTALAPATAAQFRGLVESICSTPPLASMRLHRSYFYDSAPLESSHEKPLGGGLVEFGTTEAAQRARALHEQMAQQPFMAVRLGELAFEGWSVSAKKLARATTATATIGASDLKPQITQKGVDMRIGMDIAALTLKRQVQVIVLVTGDSDFVPAMKFARREGAQLFLCPLGQRVRPSMLEHSDLVLDIRPAPNPLALFPPSSA